MTQSRSSLRRRPDQLDHPRQEPANLADILERVLDKGIVIAGDIRVNLLDVELLTIKIRLLIASVDKAREMGIDWWEHDPMLSSGQGDLALENRLLRERVEALESGRATRPAVSSRRPGSGWQDPHRQGAPADGDRDNEGWEETDREGWDEDG